MGRPSLIERSGTREVLIGRVQVTLIVLLPVDSETF